MALAKELIAKKLKQRSLDELQKELIELRTEQCKLLFQKNSGELAPKSHLFSRVRRDIARVKTVIRQMGGNK